MADRLLRKMEMHYDVIIVGASFAGLRVASRLRGLRVLLVDRKGVGADQTSACGTPLRILAETGCGDSMLQAHTFACIHTRAHTFESALPEPFCTFDYARFCQLLYAQSDAEFIRAAALGLSEEGHRVATSRGVFEAECVVDASGWRAVLATSVDKGFVDKRTLALGVETVAEGTGRGLHFWLDASLVRNGYAWNFPAGDRCHVGLGCFARNAGQVKVQGGLTRLVDWLGLACGPMHGGYIPIAMRRPTVGNLFVVGDAAGQSLPLTAEGIRPAIWFGQLCGDIVWEVIRGKSDMQAGLRRYALMVERYRGHYRLLEKLQQMVPRLPHPWVVPVVALASLSWLRNQWLPRYARAFLTTER